MPTKDDHFSVERQRQAVQSVNFSVELVAPCKIGSGILKLSPSEQSSLIDLFQAEFTKLTFFIPASGSGSRMFEKVFSVQTGSSENELNWVQNWMNKLPEMAVFRSFPLEIQDGLRSNSISVHAFVDWLINDQHLRIQTLPKGLLPFHVYPDGVKNAFQEHVLQGIAGFQGQVDFHFTIQSVFEQEIKKSIQFACPGETVKLSFSEQLESTNSVEFDEGFQLMHDDEGKLLTRPSGHGVLITNLDVLESELICIKNIDNIQHGDRKAASIEQWQILSGLLLDFRKRTKLLLDQFNRKEWNKLVEDFQLSFTSENLLDLPENEIRSILNRPYRVCGMVKNEDQPGGGPFWVKKNGIISKQIVEKAQIESSKDQLAILKESTHFNPVMLAICPYDLNGEKLDLHDYVDYDQFFVVNKTQQGKSIRYVERPGLWNGSMANWNTVFVEIPSEAFSPVKTVTDLLDEAHQPISG
jgi:hypothetical protein